MYCIVLIFGCSSDSKNLQVKEKYNVRFNLNYSNGSNTPETQSITKGQLSRNPTPDPERTGYNFDGWYETDNPNNNAIPFAFGTIKITENKTLYAKWSRVQIIVTYIENKPSGDTEVVKDFPLNQEITIISGNKATVPVINPELSDYDFIGWFEGTNTGDTVTLKALIFNFSSPITASKKLYAKRRKTQIKVTYIENKPIGVNESVKNFPSPAEVLVGRNDTLTRPIFLPELTEFDFIGWFEGTETDDTVTLNASTFNFSSPITATKRLYARWRMTGKWDEEEIAVLIVLGQSNSYGYAQSIGIERFNSPLENVFSLLHGRNPLSKTDDVIWSKLQSNLRFSLGDSDNRNLAGMSFLIGKIWQDNREALNLPDLYIVTIGTGATPIYQSASDNIGQNGWSPDLNNQLYSKMSDKVPLALRNLVVAGKKPRVIGVHWNQWESDALLVLNQNGHNAAELYQSNLERIIVGITQATNGQNVLIYLYKPTSVVFRNKASTIVGKTTFQLITEAINYHVKNRNNVKLIDPTDYGTNIFISDNVHYNLQTQKGFATF